MARNTRGTTCSADRKATLDRIAKALGKEITEVVDMGVDLVFKKYEKRMLKVERLQKTS